MSRVFDQMMSRYPISTANDRMNAQHEVMQEIALAALFRVGFFNHAAFYGGTCLRVFYGLERFSEDLDFSLLEPNTNFNLENYFDPIVDEFKTYGREVVITKKEKKQDTRIESAFLKDNTNIYNIAFRTEPQVKVKIEIDTNPPQGFSTDLKLLLLPFSFYVRTFSISDLFAGKMHALLFRQWKNRVKGRDWYDFEWYVRNNVQLNLSHLVKLTQQSEPNYREEFTENEVKTLLENKIQSLNFDLVRKDVSPFIKNQRQMDIWSQEYFLQLTKMIAYTKQ
jgi:predicted nucleotidyltransferase component of viral defense system